MQMKAIVFEEFGEPREVLSVRDVPVPEPGPGQVRVRMIASPVNPSDLLSVRGLYTKLADLPATPGFEGVGVVDSAGPGLLGAFLKGKRVAVINGATGNWQEQTVIPARQAVPLSSAVDDEQAAMFFVNPCTAYVMTQKVLRVPRGAWLVQTAAGSALGRMVIRLGNRLGYRTLNIVRRPEQVAELKTAGGDEVIACTPEEIADKVQSIVGDGGVKYALDPVAGATGSALAGCLGDRGRLLVYGTLTNEPLSFSARDLMRCRASVEGFWLGHYMLGLDVVSKIAMMRKVGKLIRKGILASQVGNTYSLDQIADAVDDSEKTGRGGKTLLKIS